MVDTSVMVVYGISSIAYFPEAVKAFTYIDTFWWGKLTGKK
jgi:hypothetical protein